jgi:predicted membrane protein
VYLPSRCLETGCITPFFYVACWTVFTEPLPGNSLIKSVTILHRKNMVPLTHVTYIMTLSLDIALVSFSSTSSSEEKKRGTWFRVIHVGESSVWSSMLLRRLKRLLAVGLLVYLISFRVSR